MAGVSATTALTGLSAFAGTAHAASNPTVDRQGGQDRFGTSALIAESQYPNGVPGGNVILATGYNYPDALAGAFLAGNMSAPVLLVPTSTSDPYYSETVAALAKLLPGSTKKVTILGGSAAVGNDVQSDLTSKGYTVSRIAGNTRYDTAQSVDTAPGTSVGNGQSGNKTCIVANGENFPDALAGGPLAFAKHFPIVLTDGTQQTLGSQASATIAADGCKNFIVLGGSAAVSQGIVTQLGTMGTVDKQVAGQDRSDTAAQLATYEISTYGFSSSANVILASGQTFPDALSSGPWGGNMTAPILLTELDGSLGQYSTAALTKYGWQTIHIAGGTAAVSSSAQQQAVTADQGGAPASTIAVSPAPSTTPVTLPASTATSPAQGASTYTVSGLPSTGTVNIALFPCVGTAQSGNNTANGAPTFSSTGQPTFTAPGGTSPQAGSAIGQGTSSGNNNGSGSGTNGTGASTGSVAGHTASAYIASVNGVPTSTSNGTNGTGGPTQVYSVSPSNGTLSFVLNSFQGDCAIPVVYTAPSTAGSTPPLLVNSNGSPQTGYSVGVGNATLWQAPNAPAAAGGYIAEVIATSPSTNSFTGVVMTGANAGKVYSFNYGTSGSSYSYTDGTPLSQAQFSQYLSGANSSQYQPNSTTLAAVPGDQIDVGQTTAGVPTTGYANGAPATFQYDATNNVGAFAGSPYGDVPAAPTSPNATYNGCAYTTGAPAVCQAGVVVTWTPPANPDVSGSQAVAAGGGAYNAANAAYNVWRSTVTNGTMGAAQNVGTVTVIATGTPNNGTAAPSTTSISSPQFVDTTGTAGATYVYYVTATAAQGTNGGGQTGPFSTASNQATAGSGATTPVITQVTITPSTIVCTSAACTSTGTPDSGTAGSALVTYNENVTCLSAAGPDFTYSNSGGSPTNAKGKTCTQTSANTLTITFPAVYQAGTNNTGGPIYAAENIANPGTGDTFTYTAPSPQTTSNAVYAGSAANPVYAASQTVTDNGNPSATTYTGTAKNPSNPLT